MATATASRESKTDAKPIPQETENLAVLCEKNLTIDPKSGAGTIPKNVYDQLLDAQDVTRSEVEKVASAHANIAAAVTLATGRAAIPLMKKHKDLDRVTVGLQATGRDRFEVVFDRSAKVPNFEVGADGKRVMNGQIDKFGMVKTAFNSFGTRRAGQLKAIREELSAQATKVLGS